MCRKKIGIIFLSFILVLSSFPLDSFSLRVFANTCTYSGSALPPNTSACNNEGRPFNDQIWKDKQLKVYGSYEDVSGNDYKVVAGGYYSKNGSRGEYRYHGFDVQGQPYTNKKFPNDEDSGRTDAEQQWIYRPWDVGLSYEQNHTMLYEEGRYVDYQRYIHRHVMQTIPNGIALPNNPPPNKDTMNYFYVYQVPNLIQPGAGVMWHKSPNNGKIYYKTFHMPQVEGRNMTPVQAEVEVMESQPIDLERYKGQSTIPVQVRVTGILQDENYIGSDADKFAFYTREDIEEWTLEITRPAGVQKQKVKTVGNQGTATFTINVPADQIDEKGTYLTNARATVHFRDKRTNGAMASTPIFFGGEGFELLSLFSVRNEIRFTELSSFESQSINYMDQSLGEIIRYDFEIKNTSTGETKTFSYNTTSVDNEVVQQELYTFIKKHFTTETVIAPKYEDFYVTQTITTQNNKQASHGEPITVIHQPNDGFGVIEEFNPVYIDPDLRVPKYGFDVVGVNIQDFTDMTEVVERACYIDDIRVSDSELFSGNYVFGIGQHGFHNVTCTYESSTGDMSLYSSWIYIIDTKPKVQYELAGPYKENRKMTITNNTKIANFPMLWEAYPVTKYDWKVETVKGADLRFSADTDDIKTFLSTTPGIYKITVVGTNDLGRVSDPYTVEFPIMRDLEPAVVLHPFDSQIARGEKVRLMYEAESVDGDNVGSQLIEVYYDSNNDGTFDQLIDSFDPSSGFTEFTPPANQLGRYQIVATVEEEFGEETISELLDGTEKRVRVAKTAFEVDNFQPAASVYTDIPYVEPDIDIYFLLDKDLARNKNNHVVSNRITINNMLRNEGIKPVVEMWDMHTYIHSSQASTTRYTGQSYPPESVAYTSGEWSGTLYRTRVSNNPYTVDEGRYETRTVTRSFSDSCTNTRVKQEDGSWSGTDRDCPSSVYINSDGFSGSIPRTGTSGPVESGNTRTFTAYYSGTLSKQETYWVSNYVTYNDYTGFYEGTVYRPVRQSYDNSFFRVTADKYVVYISDSNINDLSDLQITMRDNDASLILVGQQGMRNQIQHEHYIPNNKSIEDLIKDVVQYIAENNVTIPKTYTLINEPFSLSFNNHDAENDSIVKQESMYVHDYRFFDNNQGLASFAVQEYVSNGWRPVSLVSAFDKPGKYTVIHRVKDQPTSNPNFAEYSYYSNEAKLEVFAHRKPIALLELDWDYDEARGVYRTNWVDKSYDLDHQYSREDKGIVDRKMKLTRNNTETYTIIPDELQPGTYRLEYVVKDPEHTWSNPFVMNFTLQEAPPIQFEAKVRAKINNRFSISSIPASEELLLHDVWTRYPYNIRLEVALYQGGQRKTPVRTINYASSTGRKTGNDIYWNDITYQVPATLPDGTYRLRISAIRTTTGQTVNKEFTVRVNTPINLTPIDHPPEIIVSDPVTFAASTSKYPNHTTVTLFQGTSYQTVLNMRDSFTNQGWHKHWETTYTVPNIPEGQYTVEYLSRTPNNKTERVTRVVQVIHNRPPAAGFTITPTTIFEGDTVQIQSTAYDPDPNDYITHRYLLLQPDGTMSEYTVENPSFRVLQVGTYTLTQTVTDRFGKTDSLTKRFEVKELQITGFVTHTEQWSDTHAKIGNQENHFYSGERFMLQADVTDHLIDDVVVDFQGKQVNGQTMNLSTFLEEASSGRWRGSLYDERMTAARTRLHDGQVTFTFTVTYSNGIVKTDMVQVEIIGSVYDAQPYRRTN